MLLYTYMKTLYESILDVDAQDKMEHRASAHVNKKKLLSEILDELTDILSITKFEYISAMNTVDPNHVLGLTGVLMFYDLETKYNSSNQSDLFGKIAQSMKKTFTNYKYECEFFPGNDKVGDKYIFAPIGITLCIKKAKTISLEVYINKDDRDAINQVNKFVEKFTAK